MALFKLDDVDRQFLRENPDCTEEEVLRFKKRFRLEQLIFFVLWVCFCCLVGWGLARLLNIN